MIAVIRSIPIMHIDLAAAHHQLNDARIQSSAAVSSKFNNAVVDIVPEKRVF